MADLMVTLGADASELEKNVKKAGKTIEKELGGDKKGKGAMGGINFAENLMSGNIGAAIGGLFGPVGEAVGSFVDTLIGKAKELMDKAIELRNLSYQTGLSSQQLQGLENVSKATGVSVGKLADSISEFNRRVGYAQIHGGELNFLFNKLGVKMSDVKDGTFTYFDAINALAKAQAAGTDEAILNHYAQTLLGSSYKELLPLIKMGSENLRLYSERVYKTSQDSIDALSEAGDYWNAFTESVKNMAMDMLGKILKFMDEGPADIAQSMQRWAKNISAPEEVLKKQSEQMGPMNEKKKKELLKQAVDLMGVSNPYGEKLNAEQQKAYMNAIEKMFSPGAKGVNLNPYGLGPAQGASQMQQMGGGDLFGAVSFNPIQETAKNTAETVVVLKQIAGQNPPAQNPNRDDLNK